MSAVAQIDKAISAHAMWKARLRQIIATGQSEWEITYVSSDKNCEFGKWLHSQTSLEKTDSHWKTIQVLHAEFHLVAAQVIALALKGHREEAIEAMQSRSAFATTSAKLTKAMMDWKASTFCSEEMQHVKVA